MKTLLGIAIVLTVVLYFIAGWPAVIGVLIAAPICFGMGALSAYLRG